MKRLAILILTGVALLIPGSALAAAQHGSFTGTFTMFNPCTDEDVLITTTFHQLDFQHGDLSHTSRGTGVGAESGAEYVYVGRFVETNMQGFFDIERLISVGPGSDMLKTDYLHDPEVGPTITCS
jgi:hypothetical protein